jgi:hypothetical protein
MEARDPFKKIANQISKRLKKKKNEKQTVIEINL